MPNHVHVLVKQLEGFPLGEIVQVVEGIHRPGGECHPRSGRTVLDARVPRPADPGRKAYEPGHHVYPEQPSESGTLQAARGLAVVVGVMGAPGLAPATLATQRNRPAGKGTPTSGQFSRWGPARCPEGREPRTATQRNRPAGKGTPTSGQFSRWGRHAARRAANHASPLSAIVQQARERRPLASSPGGGRHRCPEGSEPRIATQRNPPAGKGNADLRAPRPVAL